MAEDVGSQGDMDRPADPVRCRIAPAPTGSLHVGNARTALYSWLFARGHKGTFVLRIEDTDIKRSTEEAIKTVIDSLRWLGLDWDEGPGVGGQYGPYRQTERLDLYRGIADRFVEDGRAYPCYDTPEELEERRRAALKRGETPGYDGRCRNLTPAERAAFEAEGRPKAIRFALPGTDLTFHDLVRGDVHFPANDLRDFVILRSDGTPTYLLAAAVDDVEMHMTHVIRGEDLVPSTPRQIEIMNALGATPPAYAHLPLIVGPDRQPLSKRHGSVSVERFREDGFLPEALVNYLALLGWSFDDATTFFGLPELIERFDLHRVSRNPAAFDLQKLEWMNGHYLREAADDRLAELLAERLTSEGVAAGRSAVLAAVPYVKERMRTIVEGAGLIRFLFVDDLAPDDKAVKAIRKAGPDHLRDALARLEALEDWTIDEIRRVMEVFQEDSGLSRTNAWQPIRAAVTGTTVSPPLFESLWLLGRERSLARLRGAVAIAQAHDPPAAGDEADAAG